MLFDKPHALRSSGGLACASRRRHRRRAASWKSSSTLPYLVVYDVPLADSLGEHNSLIAQAFDLATQRAPQLWWTPQSRPGQSPARHQLRCPCFSVSSAVPDNPILAQAVYPVRADLSLARPVAMLGPTPSLPSRYLLTRAYPRRRRRPRSPSRRARPPCRASDGSTGPGTTTLVCGADAPTNRRWGLTSAACWSGLPQSSKEARLGRTNPLGLDKAPYPLSRCPWVSSPVLRNRLPNRRAVTVRVPGNS